MSTDRKRKLAGRALIVTAFSLLVPLTSAAVPTGAHLVTGTVALSNGTLVSVDAQTAYPGAVGSIVVVRDLGETTSIARITVDCLHVSYHEPVYPIPPYLPYHLAQASGTTTDGTRYHIAAYDLAPRPAGLGDRVTITTEAGSGSCGASTAIGNPVESGEIVIVP